MEKIIVIGGGGHAKVVMTVLKKLGHYEVWGYTDREDQGTILGFSYLGSDEILVDTVKRPAGCAAILGIGKIDASGSRRVLHGKIRSLGINFPVICSPHAIVNEAVTLGAGTIVLDGAVVNCGAAIGRISILNTSSTVDHDCLIGENVHIASGVTISGGVTIGDDCLIGAGASIIHSINICGGCLIGAGAVVVRDVTEPGTYVGNPARRIK